MNIEWFITRRIAFRKQKSFSRFIIQIGTAAVALSVATMIITVSMVNGFQNQISEKIFGFWGHIHIHNYTNATMYEEKPVTYNQQFVNALMQTKNVKQVQQYATKAGIIKTDDDIEGVFLKGIGNDFDWNNLTQFITAGKKFGNDSTALLLSETTAQRLKLQCGDTVNVFFVQDNNLKIRRLHITGFYKTGLAEYDKEFALVNIKLVQGLNDWTGKMIGGYEVFLNDVNQIDSSGIYLDGIIGQDLKSETMKQLNPNIFDWLKLQDINEQVIIVLMLVVAIINMITAILILILERTNMIGLMKAMGSSNWQIRKIFLYNAAIIISVGLLLGNFFGISLCALQQNFHLLKLPEETYYLSEAPVELQFSKIIFINAGTLIICTLMMLFPSWLVSRITPIKAIRFN